MSDLPSGGPLPDENAELPEDEIEEASDDEGKDAEDGQARDDDADGEDAGDEGDGEEERPARDVSQRRESRPQRLRRENQELRERLARLEGAVSQRPVPGYDPMATQRAIEAEENAFRESLQFMDPTQQLMAVRDRERRAMGGALQQMRAETRDEVARMSFEAKADRNPVYAQFRDRVLEAVQQERRNGNYAVTYEAAFRYLVGEDAVRKAERAGQRQSRQGAARVRAQTTRPTNGRGDTARGGRQPADSYEADLRRLEEAERRGERFL